MRSKKHFTVAAALLLATSTLRADVIPGRWNKVDSLGAGTAIIVTMKTGDRLEGDFKSSGPAELVLTDARGGERSVPKSEVTRVESAAEVRDRLRNGAIIGAAVGCGAAMLVLAGYASNVTSSGQIWGGEATPYYVGAALVGSGIGALAGMGIDAAGKSREVLYRAQ